MNGQINIKTLTVIGIVLISCLMSTTVMADSGPEITISDTTISEGEVTTIPVILKDAPNGVSGYTISAFVSDNVKVTSVATGKEFTAITESSSRNGSIEVTGADFSQSVQSGDEDIVLFEIGITGDVSGTYPIEISVDKFENAADPPKIVEPTVASGQITVRDTSSDVDQDDSGTSSGTNDGNSAGGSPNLAEEYEQANATEGQTKSNKTNSNSNDKSITVNKEISNQDGTASVQALKNLLKQEDTDAHKKIISPNLSTVSSDNKIPESDIIKPVDQIIFNKSSVNTSIKIIEHRNLSQSVKNYTKETVSDDLGKLNNRSTVNNSKIKVHSVTEITPVKNSTQTGSARVRLSVARDKITNKSHLAVLKTDKRNQTGEVRWIQIKSFIQNVSAEKVTIVANVDSFSLFAITEISEAPNSADESTNTNTPGFEIGITVISVLTLLAFLHGRKR